MYCLGLNRGLVLRCYKLYICRESTRMVNELKKTAQSDVVLFAGWSLHWG
jgi:hypothetical protein